MPLMSPSFHGPFSGPPQHDQRRGETRMEVCLEVLLGTIRLAKLFIND